MVAGGAAPSTSEAAQPNAGQGFPASSTASPFYIQPQQMPQIVTTSGLPLAPAAGIAGSGSIDPSLLQSYLSSMSSGGSSNLGGSFTLSLQDQQALASGQLPAMGSQRLAYVEVGPAGNPIVVTNLPPHSQFPLQSQPSGPGPAAGQPARAGSGAAQRTSKARPKRPYKPPAQVAQERKLKDEANEYIRRLEQQLGKARSDLERLQRDNRTLQRKAVVLSKHNSFRRCAAGMVQELQESLTISQQLEAMDSSQRVLDAAEKGLPEPAVLERLRRMTRDDAVAFYNGVVSQVRELLRQLEDGPDPAPAAQQLEDIFTLKDKGSTFGYLQVVNPPVYAELMQAKLDPASPVDRNDPAHWRGCVAAMALSEEQESQLILLLQSYLQQAEQIVQRKSKVMQQLADELSQDLLSLELSQDGSNGDYDLLSDDSSGVAVGDGGGAAAVDMDAGPQRQPSSNPRAQQAKAELDRLVQLEYWLKFDFTGCVRKLLPAQQQALCMVHSWPFYPDHKQLEAALKERAGSLWEQLARSSS